MCVLLDARLPDGHGVELLRDVQSDLGSATLPVMVITGDDGPDVEIELLRAGAADFLVKPVGVERLLARVDARLRNRASWLATLDAVGVSSDGDPSIRAGIEAVIAQAAFHPVFQPIVDLRDSSVVGFEALTRFEDGVAPDNRFQQAARVGYGPDLELVTLTAAVDSSHRLDNAAFISLNVTPSLLDHRIDSLQDVVIGASQPLVLEITEREAIDDYTAVKRSIRELEPRVMLSIDDAGAGFASLRHVVMLEPDYVKLDRGWVSGIDAEPAKQAMVAGLVHFAGVTGATLIAEGVETAGELACLVDMGVELAQGFLLGRPSPVG